MRVTYFASNIIEAKQNKCVSDQWTSVYFHVANWELRFQLEEDMFSCGGEVRGGRVPPPSLGPPPDALTAVQLRRRHVVAAIIHSENSYVATLQRLVNVSI